MTTNAKGCQDTATLNLTINKSVNTTTPVTSCNSYTWSVDGKTYTASGVYFYITTGATGCQDTATLNLTINKSVNTTTPVTSCNSYTWSRSEERRVGKEWNLQITTEATGCQDTATLNLTINKSVNTTTPVTSCNSYTWSVDVKTYTASGVYLHITTGATGCQDTATLNLTINKSVNTTTPVTSCNSYTWSVDGKTYTS